MRGNTITLHMARGRVAQTGNLFQFDYGQRLILAGLTLPVSYEVHFSNAENGQSKTVLGDATGVDIPDEYLLTGEKIHVWVFVHDGADDGETEYHGIINVTKRARPSDAPPTPVQQDAITQAIAALNAGVAEVEGIAEGIPQTIDNALEAAKESGEFDGKDGKDGKDGADGQPGADGFSPTATVTKSGHTTTISITDQNGTTTATVSDGQDGQPGADGKDGKDGKDGTDGVDGFSPTATVTKSGKVATITITDKNGTTTETVSDGADADPTTLIDDTSTAQNKVWSASKTSSEVSNLNNQISANRAMIADAETSATAAHAHAVKTVFILDNKLLMALSAIAVGDTITTTGATPNAAEVTLADAFPHDVQVDGTSVVTDGVANVPVATGSTLGVVKASGGIAVNNEGTIYLSKATDATVKQGTNTLSPLVPSNQHNAAFYGLAKAAGADMASLSSVTVGQYPEAQKKAICAMIGVKYDAPYRLISEITITEATGNISITTDMNGDPILLSDVVVYFQDLVATLQCNTLVLVNGDNYLGKHITINNLYNTSARSGVAFLNVVGGRFFGESMVGYQNTYNVVGVSRNLNASGILECNAITSIVIGPAQTSSLTAGKITVWGR